MNKVYTTSMDEDPEMMLRLEVAYSNLFRAYMSNDRNKMIWAYTTATNAMGDSFFNNKIAPATQRLFVANGYLYPSSVNIHSIANIGELRLNIEGCMCALQAEMNQRPFYIQKYQRAQRILFQPYHVFVATEIVHRKEDKELKVADLLSVLRYSLGIAEMTANNPSDPRYAYANAATTALQGIDAILNNRPTDKPVNKMLHLAASFISSVVKSSLTNNEDKREAAAMSLLVDLTIDFFVGR